MSQPPHHRRSSPPAVHEDQAEVVAFLADPASYPGAIGAVDRMETHGALIFLAGPRAYKIKRAVDLGYLDFSTLEKRATACHNEIERNQKTAPDIYIAAEPIVRTGDGGLALGGAGDPVEWVVVMNRFDQAGLFDNLALEGRLPLDLMTPLAEAIAAYHESASTCPDRSGKEIITRVVTGTIQSLAHSREAIGEDALRRFALRTGSELHRLAHSLEAGDIRLCHGDLHLKNIVLLNGAPTLFDAIEFDDDLARIDLLYDLAFLLMDLWHRDLPGHANACFNAYVNKAMVHSLDGLSLLPLFMAARASIRAMVTADKAALAAASDPSLDEELLRYFQLANRFLETPEPVLIAIGGISGTGKTTLAAALAPSIGRAPGALHLRSDVERKRMAGLDPLERLPPEAYSKEASADLYARLWSRARAALAAGQSVVVDATFIDNAHRDGIESVAAELERPFAGIWLTAPKDCVIQRVEQRRNDASDADENVILSQLAARPGPDGWQQVQSGGSVGSVLSTAQRVLTSTFAHGFDRIVD